MCGVIGKGHTAVLLAVEAGGRVAAAKVRRLDSRRESLWGEAERLLEASRHGASPRPLAWNRDVILMELVTGPTLGEALRLDPLRAVSASLEAARALDTAGILHHEIHRPWRNILFTGPTLATAVIVDLDSAGEGCGNPAKLLGGLTARMPGLRSREVLEAAREYKRECSRAAYEGLRKAVLEALSRA